MTDRSTTDSKNSSAPPNPGGWRVWLLRLVLMLVVPLLLLLALEFGLRLSGYGYPTTFFIRNNFSGREVYTDNPDFGLRFFPRALLRFSGPCVFPAQKPAGTYRIFVLGESAAEGVPAPAYSFSRILEVMLQERFPEKRFEVINTGTTAINSHVIVPIAREIARYQPDLIVVYMGNNEVIGPYGPATVLSSYSPSLRLIRTTVFLRSTKLGQLLNNAVAAFIPDQKAPKGWGGMAMFLQHRIGRDDPRLTVVYDHFRQNMKDICRAGVAANSRIIISTVGVNLKDSAPFASQHRAGLSPEQKTQWQKLYDAGMTAEKARNYRQATENFEKAAEIDDEFADLQFRLGRCYWALREYSRARKAYEQARDLDVVRFRTDSRLNNIIRTIATSEEMQASKLVELADTEQMFAQHSPQQLPGENLFYEHVHMNFEGNYLLALNVLQKAEKHLPASSAAANLLSEEQCRKRLASTPWDNYIISQTLIAGASVPPFTNQLDHDEQMERMKRRLQFWQTKLQSEGVEQSIKQYEQAIMHRPNDWVLHKGLGDLLLQQARAEEAIGHFEAMRQQLPHSPWAQRLLIEANAKRALPPTQRRPRQFSSPN